VITVLLVCYIAGADWKPPDLWTVRSISNRAASAAVQLSREVKDGETVQIPAGCRTDEPTASSPFIYGGLMMNNNVCTAEHPCVTD
jgi:hypothetical protein